jgi:Peptidase family M28
MLTLQQKTIVLASAIVTMLVMGLLASHGLHESSPPQFKAVQSRFDPADALESARVLAENYPDRVTGSAGSRRAAEYLSSEFRKMDYRVSGDMFTMWLAGKRVEGESVIAELAGDSPESVAVIAHYDGPLTSHQAAEDNASGVGVMLELARVLRSAPHHRGLIFVATDAEEWGMIGARSLAGFFKSRQTIAVISIDYLNQGPADGLAVDCEGQHAGYTPIWLRELIERSAALQGARVNGPSGFREWVDRALEVPAHDQGPLLRAGIPAINISTIPVDKAGARARYHSPHDVFENFQPATFEMVGATVEQTVSALDQIGREPPREMTYLRFAGGRWLDRTTVEWLQALGVFPFMLACVLAVLDIEEDRLAKPVLSYLRPGIYLIPVIAALVTLRALTRANILTRYELYPATAKDPFLQHIQGRVIIPLVVVLLAGYAVVRLLRRWMPPPPRSFAASKRTLGVWVYMLVVWALYLDPFAMWLFLSPFAYGFLLLRRPSGMGARLLNLLLLLVGAVPFLVVVHYIGRATYVGWKAPWYLVLQSAYGVWSPWGSVAFLLAATLWLQLFRLTVLGPSGEVGFRPAAKSA